MGLNLQTARLLVLHLQQNLSVATAKFEQAPINNLSDLAIFAEALNSNLPMQRHKNLTR